MEYFIQLKDKKVPIIIRNYRQSRVVKMYFKGSVLNISKPLRCSQNEVVKIIRDNEDKLYSQYNDIISLDSKEIKHWSDGEKIFYKGQEYVIKREKQDGQYLRIIIDEVNKNLRILSPLKNEEEIKEYVDRAIKKLFKNNTEAMLMTKLPHWSNITKLEYKSFKVRDATTKYGSCKPRTRELYFSSRLIMLPEDIVDSIIVHELCHIVHKNHSKEFYDLVKKYIPNYDDIRKWLKVNNKIINI